jgi:folate-binding protein YgfZ
MTEPGLGETVRTQLLRSRFAAKVEIEPEEHQSWLVIGEGEVLDQRPEGEEASDEDVERWRIESGLPLWGNELDETILPAEAGLDQTHISFTKGCYPGQEPIARQHYRGKVNRRLRVLEIDGAAVPAKDTELVHDGKVVGRITSAVRGLALGYVRVDVPPDEALLLKGSTARARPR